MEDESQGIWGVVGTIRGIIEIPFNLFLDATGIAVPSWSWVVWDVFAVAVIVLILRWLLVFVLDLFRREKLADKADIDALIGKHASFEQAMQDPAALRATTAHLKRTKQWGRLGEAYAAINHHKKAAQYFKKAKDHVRAADMMAKADKLPEAARSLMRAGDFENAGRFYFRAERYAKAAKAYAKAGMPAKAAGAWAKAGKHAKAVDMFAEYFQAPRDDKKAQIEAAHACFELLEDPKAKIDPEKRRGLLGPVAQAFEAEQSFDKAGQLYREAGQLERAAEAYVKSGKLELAVECYKQANKPREAARIGGRFYEKAGKWREAGMAYAGGEEFLRAAECFAKADEPVRAAEYFMRSKEYARAGLMFAKAQRLQEAIDALQKVPESDKQFDASRALLGRCFYEMHDYAHCAATLENHLLGKRVEKANMDYFYMLALAKEQLGLLQESRDILYKIGAVEREYRDLNTRISSIDSRISMMGSQGPISQGPPIKSVGGNGGDMAVMSMVQNQLGERYEIEKEIGRGGMGVVYLARDKQLDRKVALKFLGTLVDNNEEYRQRFVREAKTAAKINHPNIVAIYDISASQGKAYIAMEFVEGMSLHNYIEKKGKLPVREAINYMAQACAALYALHSCGIVHRDIKPDNIIIGKGGLIKLMDFGLAKADDNRITKSNIIMGTPCYMSPEQVQGKEVDGRADIYAMGLVLYEMISGKCVFRDGDILTRQMTEMPPKLSELVEGVPPALDEFAHKCIAKKPEDRFENCKKVVEAIRGLGVG